LRDNRWSALRCPIVGSIPARLQNSLCFKQIIYRIIYYESEEY